MNVAEAAQKIEGSLVAGRTAADRESPAVMRPICFRM